MKKNYFISLLILCFLNVLAAFSQNHSTTSYSNILSGKRLDLTCGATDNGGSSGLLNIGIPNNHWTITQTTANSTYALNFYRFSNGVWAGPLITLTKSGSLGINRESVNENYKLDVWGKVRAHEIVVNSDGADFVFSKDYNLKSLYEVESFIGKHQHLEGIPSATEMQSNGLGLAELNTKLLQKIEEITLYLIDQHKTNEIQAKKIEDLELELEQIRQFRK